MHKLNISLDELAFVLNRGETIKIACFLDLATGNILNVPTERQVLKNLIDNDHEVALYSTTELVNKVMPKNKSVIPIPNLFNQYIYDLMNKFIVTAKDEFPDSIESLSQAVHNKGGYTDFRQIVLEEKDMLKRYISVRDDFYEQIALNWLKENEIELI